jgi:hypothetical protein
MDSELWYALSGIGTIFLAIVTFWSLRELKNQVSLMRSQGRISRLKDEMTKLIAPLMFRKNGVDGKYYFDLNRSTWAPEYLQREHEISSYYYNFWDGIKFNMYLGPDYLWTALYNYMNTKEKYYTSKKTHNTGDNRFSGIIFDNTDECKEILSNFDQEYALLKSQIERRYFEILNELHR